MSECNLHALTLSHGVGYQKTVTVPLAPDNAAATADFHCPECGHILFVYYRQLPGEKVQHEHDSEATADVGGDHDAQPPPGQEQQTERDKE